ncbi:SDR family NAD(P)-dependent oxidoreductase, partial [Myxococcota bacterium]|nr:SDR family NAD(P)-dependent oxidoreductase [Myxococcota bacterium]
LGILELSTVRKIIETNLLSVFNILEVVVPVLRSQNQRSQLAICASAAGYVGLPGSQPYGSSKAGLIHLVESLKAEYGKSIDIKLINPGFVESRLTDKNEFYMPFRITAEKAAKRISSGLNSRKFEIHFPKRFTYLMKLVAFLPYRIYFFFFRQRNDDS